MVRKAVLIIGGGPAGLMAAEVLAKAGHRVTLCDAMPSLGRKFLLAGKSGLNITHSEPYERFRARFGEANAHLAAALDCFTPDDVRAWAQDLGTSTFVGSSGRVFPTVMKASPLLRAWLKRLQAEGVILLTRHRFLRFDAGVPILATPEGEMPRPADAVLLALGGASWPRLGSDASWVDGLKAVGVPVAPFQPANCGFDIAWSDRFRQRFQGAPVKAVRATSAAGESQGEFVISRHGIEGSLVYAHAAALRDQLARDGQAALLLDLAPGRSERRIEDNLLRQPPKTSLSNRLRKAAGLDGVKVALFNECRSTARLAPSHAGAVSPQPHDGSTGSAADIAGLIKRLPLAVLRPRPIEEAISSAGGISWDGLDPNFMLRAMPGVFAAGEMLDWEAPTGGYLLTACLATGRAAGRGIDAWLTSRA
jgi:uncharacterized flavoprotein (TIGR03862 family)